MQDLSVDWSDWSDGVWRNRFMRDADEVSQDTVECWYLDYLRKQKRRWSTKKRRLVAKASALGIESWGALTKDGLSDEQAVLLESSLRASGLLVSVINPDCEDEGIAWELSISGIGTRDHLTLTCAKSLLEFACGDAERLMAAIRLEARYPGVVTALSPYTRLPTRALGRLEPVYQWLRQANFIAPEAFSYPAARYLARLSVPLRYAALHRVSAPSKSHPALSLSALNWEMLRKAKKDPGVRLQLLPPALQWHHLFGFGSARLKHGDLHGFKAGVFKRLCRQLGVKLEPAALRERGPALGDIQAIYNLVRLFGDEQSVRRFVKARNLEWTCKGVHDAGQFTLPSRGKWTPAKWAPLCLRHPQAVTRAQEFARLEAKGSIPSSYADLRRDVILLGYPTVKPGFEALAEACSEAGVSGSDYETYERFWRDTPRKPAEFLPRALVRGEELGLERGWAFFKLDSLDYRGPMLGHLTGCCQHLTGAGSASAVHGVTSPFSAFYVVTHHDKVIAQSWAWLTTTGGLVFDSLESKVRDSKQLEPVFKLFAEGAKRLAASPFGITGVYVGSTFSGVTRQALEWLDVAVEAKRYCSTPADYGGYYDGAAHVLIAGRVVLRTKAKLPSVEGYSPITKRRAHARRDNQEQPWFAFWDDAL